MIATQLALEQQLRREDCDNEIRQGFEGIKASLKQVGAALGRVRDERLYLLTHATFDEYVSQQWNLTRARAYQLIEYSNALENLSDCEALSTVVDTISERATRELSGLHPDDQKEVVLKASNGGTVTPTARMIRDAKESKTPDDTHDSDEVVNDNHALYKIRLGSLQLCSQGYEYALQVACDPNSPPELVKFVDSILLVLGAVHDHVQNSQPGKPKTLTLIEAGWRERC